MIITQGASDWWSVCQWFGPGRVRQQSFVKIDAFSPFRWEEGQLLGFGERIRTNTG